MEQWFYIGKQFESIAASNKVKQSFEDCNFIELWKKVARTLAAAKKRTPKRVESINPEFEYYSLLFACKFAGKPRKKANRQKETKSFRQSCPFQICLRASADGNALEATRMNLSHNHEVSKELYQSLPRQRSLLLELLEEVRSAIKLKTNNKPLRQKIEQETGKMVTLKDFSNIKCKSKLSLHTNDIESIVEFLQKQGTSTVDVMVDNENNFKALFYDNLYMENMFDKFPEMILADATYKLLDLRLPAYLLLVIDGNGFSEIAVLFLVEEESKEVISSVVNKFKERNEAWFKTKVIMSDKDFIEREIFSACFPEAGLLICLYHALLSFRREIKCQKMGITSAECNRALEIIQPITYSKSEALYNENVKLLQDTKLDTSIDYFMENWDCI